VVWATAVGWAPPTILPAFIAWRANSRMGEISPRQLLRQASGTRQQQGGLCPTPFITPDRALRSRLDSGRGVREN
jgi:hypothetical protein